MGRSIAIGSKQIQGVDVITITDVQIDRGKEAFNVIEYDNKEVTSVDTVDEGDEALENNQLVVTADGLLPSRQADVDPISMAKQSLKAGDKIDGSGEAPSMV